MENMEGWGKGGIMKTLLKGRFVFFEGLIEPCFNVSNKGGGVESTSFMCVLTLVELITRHAVGVMCV